MMRKIVLAVVTMVALVAACGADTESGAGESEVSDGTGLATVETSTTTAAESAEEEAPAAETAAEGAPDPAADYFVGTWAAQGYNCPAGVEIENETIEITARGDDLVAIKVVGDECVMTDEITFTARWDGSGWVADWFFGSVDDRTAPAIGAVDDPLIIVGDDEFRGLGGSVSFQRVIDDA